MKLSDLEYAPTFDLLAPTALFRIQRSRAALRDGRPIAEVAQAFGFADQAHLQRAFKRLVAATPGEYRRG